MSFLGFTHFMQWGTVPRASYQWIMKLSGCTVQAVARIADLRRRLADDDLIKADVAEATRKLIALGLSLIHI